jgi:hypothetical protein
VIEFDANSRGLSTMSKRLLILLIAVVTACGGTAATTTEAEPDETTTTTTTAAPVDEAGGDNESGETVDFADMPQECIDAFVDFLRAIEPTVEGFDFENATIEDMETMGTELEAVAEGPTADMESLDCPDPSGTDEETFTAMIDIAEREAPGTVAYFEWIEELAGSFGGGAGTSTGSSGDCETDIAAMEAIIAEHETMADLTMDDIAEFGALMTTITGACSTERAQEFLSQPEVQEFMNSGG